MADSAECPDGYPTVNFDAAYRSTCNADAVARDGVLHVAVNAGKERDLEQALRDSGLATSSVSVGGAASKSCDTSTFTMMFAGLSARPLSCQAVNLNLDVQSIRCSDDIHLDPPALQIGPRDVNEGGAGDAQADGDSADADAGDGGRFDADADAGREDGGLTPGAPAVVPDIRECTVSFTKVPGR